MSRYDRRWLYTCDSCGRSEDGDEHSLPRDWTEITVRVQEVLSYRTPPTHKNFITHTRHICYECTGTDIVRLKIERGRIEECNVTVLLGGIDE